MVPAIDPDTFRAALSRVPAPVTVVTTLDASGAPCGCTVSAVCALSLRPPLVLACVARGGSSHGALLQAGRFMVNLLSAGQEAVARRFAGPRHERFAPDSGVRLDDGLPALPGCPVRLSCRTHAVFDGGDHSILVGLVTAVSTVEGEPLVHYDRAFTRPAALERAA